MSTDYKVKFYTLDDQVKAYIENTELFFEKGIFDHQTAKSFEENILSKGGTEHPITLYKRFRGKAPDPKALLKRAGLVE